MSSIYLAVLPNVHSADIFSVGRRESGVIHQEVGVNKIQVNIVNQSSRVPQVRVKFLNEQ